MKIYPDAIGPGGVRKSICHFLIKILLLGISLAAGGLVPTQSIAQSKPQPNSRLESNPQSEMATLQALMKRVESENPRPAKVSATQVKGNGYWETQDLELAWLGVMRRFLPEVRNAHPDLIRYWVLRTEERDYPDGIEPDKDGHYKWAFSWQALKVVASTPALSQWAVQLRAASDSLIQGVREEFWNLTDDVTKEEKTAKSRAIHIEGRRLALIKVIRGMLGSAGDLDPERNPIWKPLYQFLTQDANRKWIKDSKDRDKKRQIDFSLSATYYGAHNPPPAITARFEKLEAINQRLTTMTPQLVENALAFGQTPMTFLEGNGSEFMSSQIEFDRQLASALDSAEVRANPSLIRAFGGMYDIWGSLTRYEDVLRAGKGPQSVGLLIDSAHLVQKAAKWKDWNELDPATGKSINDFVGQQAGQTIDVLNKYKESWIKHGAPDAPLYAAVEVDEQGRRVWTHSSWVLWKWIGTDELDELKIDGRVLEGLGRRWLLPAGSPVRSIRSLQDVRTADAREVILGLDPAGAGKGRKTTP